MDTSRSKPKTDVAPEPIWNLLDSDLASPDNIIDDLSSLSPSYQWIQSSSPGCYSSISSDIDLLTIHSDQGFGSSMDMNTLQAWKPLSENEVRKSAEGNRSCTPTDCPEDTTSTIKPPSHQLPRQAADSDGSLCQNPTLGQGPAHGHYHFRFTLDAPMSVLQKHGEDSLTYLNKSQFYTITLEAERTGISKEVLNASIPSLPPRLVRSYVYLVFRAERDSHAELNHWQFWHSQQANVGQRAFDVDTQSSQNVIEHLGEIGLNAAGFTWCPDVGAKILVRINCLSTDFSPQKGIRGVPLHIQIDTYAGGNSVPGITDPVHQAYCQIKVFRDKGAERKNKEEQRLAERMRSKFLKPADSGSGIDGSRIVSEETLHLPGPFKVTAFRHLHNSRTLPFVYRPAVATSWMSYPFEDSFLLPSADLHTARLPGVAPKRPRSLMSSEGEGESDDMSSSHLRTVSSNRKGPPARTLYVRQEKEPPVYKAVFLDTLCVSELKYVLSTLCKVRPDKIQKVLLKTRKGLLVEVENRLLENLADEEDFVICLDGDDSGLITITLSSNP